MKTFIKIKVIFLILIEYLEFGEFAIRAPRRQRLLQKGEFSQCTMGKVDMEKLRVIQITR